MLVLSRKIGESILINDNIEVQVVGIYKDKVKIGITAPKDVKIFRNEIYGTTIPEKNISDIADDTAADKEIFGIIDYGITTDNDDIF